MKKLIVGWAIFLSVAVGALTGSSSGSSTQAKGHRYALGVVYGVRDAAGGVLRFVQHHL